MKTSEFIKHNTNYIKKSPLLSVQVLAHCAAAYEKRQELTQYKNLLQDAKRYCKDFGLEQHPIYEGLNNRLVYLSQKELGTSLFEDLEVSISQESDAFYGFDEIFSNCPICRRRLYSTAEIISCSTCDSSYHRDCLVDANLHTCPICTEALNLTKEE